jgi:FixJ family two-component response regulator
MTAPPLISVIDDDESMRTAIMGLIRSLGYEVRGYVSADEFLAEGDLHSVSCIVSDIQMAGMTGIELTRLLRQLACNIPVIMITARTEPGLYERALASGAHSFLQKPFAAAALIGAIEKILLQ